jgi:hypothetical protein
VSGIVGLRSLSRLAIAVFCMVGRRGHLPSDDHLAADGKVPKAHDESSGTRPNEDSWAWVTQKWDAAGLGLTRKYEAAPRT